MITRHNYEEFFLLYVDHELSAADRQMVESFVADHSDLRAELNVLLQCRLDPAKDAFPDKAKLLRPLVTEESLLLYIDGELNGEAGRAVEMRAQEDPALGRELALLRQTINEPDTAILYADKELLYKREGERRVAFVPMFTRPAAAVLLLVLAGLAVLFLVKKKEGPVTAGATGKKVENTALRPGKNSEAAVTRNTSRALYPSMVEQRVEVARVKKTLPEATEAATAGATEAATPGTTAGTTAGAMEATKKSNPTMAVARIETDRSGHPLPAPGLQAGTIKGGTFATDALREEGSVASLPGEDPDRADVAENGADGNKGEDADAGPSRKRRLRGVFRTVTRVFERTTNQADEDRHGILIGNLQIALK